jgi:serine/arginine repetitive matrix protein 2
LPAAEIHAIEQRLYDVANQPVKKKKKKRVAPLQATGTHLADGTVGGRPRGTAIDAMEAESSRAPGEPRPTPLPAPTPVSEPTLAPAPTSTAAPKKKKKKVVVVSDSDSDQASYAPNSSDNDSDSPRPATFNTRLAKKPSIVREDKEREEEEDDTLKRAKASDNLPRLDTGPVSTRPISPTPVPRSNAGRGHGRGKGSASAAFAQERQQTRPASQPAPAPLDSTVADSIAPRAAKGSVRGGRVQSVSPARTPHFSTVPDNLQVKHQPPPRSISPRKSALKHPSTARGPSPSSGDGSAIGQATSETSEELSVPRKKANRVSFDESNVVVGQAATPVTTDSPIVQSPQVKRPWYSIGRGKKKDTAAVDDNDDEIMKPRPALPSFGSVRAKKEKPQEEKERPLVKPAEPTETTEPPASPLFTTPTGEVVEHPIGQSNDHAVGSVLSLDAASKNAANISKSREPLPPQVLSVEGSGFNSETNSSATSLDVEDSALAAAKIESGNTAPVADEVEALRDLATPIPEEKEGEHDVANGEVPAICILQATRTLKETVVRAEWPDMPGGWRNSNSHSESSASLAQEEETPPIVEHHVIGPTPADVGIAEPDPSTPRAGSPALGDIAAENSHSHGSPVIVEEPEESDASIYSDAAEDLSDTEGDGFMSLDAVVESPVVPSSQGSVDIPVPDSPTPKAVKERAYKQSQLSKQSSESDPDEGWDKAQEYWKSLSAEKKRQLEEEARADAEDFDGSDTEVEVKPAPKPKKKKKVKVAPISIPEQRQPATNQRTYMISPGSKAGPNGHAPMRSSMRAEPPSAPSDTHIRKSMKAQDLKRNSLRAAEPAEPKGALQKKMRPMSYPLPQKGEFVPDPAIVDDLVKKMSKAKAAAAPTPAAGKKTTRPASTQGPSPTLRRRGSGDSDSSFKRVRSGSTASDIPSFRRSMRGSNEPNNSGRHDSPAGSSRFSLRSLSPTGSTIRRPFNSGGVSAVSSNPTHMRMSMRNSSGPTPTMRAIAPAPSRAKSPLRLGFGRSSSKPSKQKITPKRSSRFADSSDEDEGPSAFRSRFADSDDSDGEPSPLTRQIALASKSMRASAPPSSSAPVRGIPKCTGAEDGDSSDLPDSDDEKAKSPTTQAPNGIRKSGSGRGAIGLNSSTTTTVSAPGRLTHQRRGSIMSILRRKKPDPVSKVRKSELESPARRDTPLERSKSDLDALRQRSQSPKLQKRNPMFRENSSSWPLPEPQKLGVPAGEDGRPVTVDATSASGSRNMPDMGDRRNTATGVSEVDVAGVTAGLGKGRKKKFGALRRMFRLDD